MALLAKSMKPSELAFSIVFDEMAIKKHLDYNKALDRIDVLTTKGETANQAMVLMARGLASKWKQVSSPGGQRRQTFTCCLIHLTY